MIQVAKVPKSKRYPTDFYHTHRASVLKMNDGEGVIESERLANVLLPRERSKKPVALGVFIFGFAPDSQTGEADGNEEPKQTEE
eukprot:1618112-Prorocentrum_lima.AAC.1